MRKMLIGLMTMGALLFGALVSASPAQAVPTCSTGFICFYDTGVSAGSLEYRDGEDTSVGECHSMNSTANNKTSYITNRYTRTWRVYDTGNCTGTSAPVYAGTSGPMNSTWNNNISSYKLF
jgi:hypothetical protein